MKKLSACRCLRFCAFYFFLSAVLFCLLPGLSGPAWAATATIKDRLQEDAFTDSRIPFGTAYPVDRTHRLAYTDKLHKGAILVNNVGSDVTRFRLKYQRAALKFNISGINGTITDARLKIYVVDAYNKPVVHLIASSDDSWNQTNQKFPEYHPTEIVNGYFNSPVTASSWKVFNVTKYLQNVVDGGTAAVCFVLKGTEGGDSYFNFVSNLETVQTDFRPVLEITYTPPAAAPAVSGVTPTNNLKPTWNWTGNGGGNGGFRYKLDSSDLSSGASSTTALNFTPASNLKEGKHTLYVQESNGATPARWSPNGSFTINVVTTPPEGPKFTGKAQTNTNTPTWTWASGHNGSGTFRYKLDNSDLSSGATTATTTSFTPGNALTEGEHILYVQERDAAGNWSAAASFAVTIDKTPPGAPVVTGPSLTNNPTPIWTWHSGGNGSGTYRCKLDDGDMTHDAITLTETNVTPDSALNPGKHTLFVQESDAAGNWSATGSFTITVDTSAPTYVLSHDHKSNFVKAGDTVTLTAAFTKDMIDTPTINITNTEVKAMPMVNGNGDHRTWKYSWKVPDGNATAAIVTVAGSDAAGNAATGSNELSFRIDNTAPTVTLATDHQNSFIKRGDTLTITALFSDKMAVAPRISISKTDIADVTMKNGKGDQQTWTYLWTVPDGDTQAVVTVKGNDLAGNAYAGTDKLNFTIKNTPPQGYGIKIEQSVINRSNQKVLSFGLSSAEIGATYDYIISSNGGEPVVKGSGPVDTAAPRVAGIDVSGLKDGQLSLGVTLTDKAGNRGVPATASVAKDTLMPVIVQLTQDHSGNHVKTGDSVIITAVFNKPMADAPTIHISNGSVSGFTMSNGNGDHRTWTYLWTVPAGNAAAIATFAGNDEAGNVFAGTDSLSFLIDNIAPGVTLSTNHLNNKVKKGDVIPFIAVFNKDVVDAPTISISNGGVTEAPMTNNGGDHRTWSYLWTVPDGNATAVAMVAGKDAAGNPSVSDEGLNFTIDNTPPEGYEVAINQTVISNSNRKGFSFTVTGAEPGAIYHYVISSNGGGLAVSHSGIVRRAKQTVSKIDVSSLGDGTLTLEVALIDAAGNQGSVAKATVLKDTAPPVLISFTHNHSGNQVKVNDQVLITAIFNKDMADTPTVNTGGSAEGAPMTNASGDHRTWTYLWTVPDGNATVAGTVAGSDTLGNAFSGKNSLSFVIDNTVPSGYSVKINQDAINNSNKSALSFSLTGAELGTTYSYTISSSGGGSIFIGSYPISSPNQTVSDIDVSGLKDGTLTLIVTLTDAAGNTGSAATATVLKNSSVPEGYQVSINQANINSGNQKQLSFSFAGAETGATYRYSISCSGGGIDLKGSGQVSEMNQMITGIDVSGLKDGILTLHVTLTNPTGNTGTVAAATVKKDTVIPQLTSLAHNHSTSQVKAGDAVLFTAVFDKDMANAPAVHISNTNVSAAAMTNASGDHRTWTYLWTVASGNAMAVATVTGKDMAGNDSIGDNSLSFIIDNIPPLGYSIAADQKIINKNNQTAFSFGFKGAEIGTTYRYIISSSGGDAVVKGNGIVSSPNQPVAGIDVSGLNDGILTLSVTLTDAAGNSGTTETAQVSKDATVLMLTSLTHNHRGTFVKAGEAITFTALFNKDVFDAPRLNISNTPLSKAAMINGNGDHRTWTYLWTVPALNTEAVATVTAKDPAGNVYGGGNSLTFTIDNKAPEGYQIKLNQTTVNKGNQKVFSFSFAGAEPGTSFDYTISSTGGGPLVKGSGRIEDADQTLSGIDVTNLPDGKLTLSFTLTDAAGNVGNVASVTINKNIKIPNGYGIRINQRIVNGGTQKTLSFSLTEAEIGTIYNYTISSNNGSAVVKGSGPVNDMNQMVSKINVSKLADGILTLQVTLADKEGNTGSAVTATVPKDTAAPVLTTLNHNQAGNQIKAGSVVKISAVFNKDMVNSPLINISGGGVSGAAMTNDGGDHRTWSFSWTVPEGDMVAVVTISGTDSAGNPYTGDNSLTFTVDNTAPSGYSVVINQGSVNNSNQKSLSFTLSGTEAGATYQYSLTSSGGGTPINGSGPVANPTQTVTGIDVSGLNDGKLLLKVALTDEAGNTGKTVMAWVDKDATVPAITRLTHNRSEGNQVRAGEAILLTAVFNKDMASAPTIQITNVGISGAAMSNNNGDHRTWTYLWRVPAANATAVVTVAGIDTGGNFYSGRNSLTFIIDNTAPRDYSVTIDQAVLGTDNQNTLSFTLKGAEIGTNCQYTITTNDGGSLIYGSFPVSSANQTVGGIDVSELADGPLTLSLTLTDAAGNTGDAVTATVNKDTSAK